MFIRLGKQEDVDFSTDILQDLVAKGYANEELVKEFSRLKVESECINDSQINFREVETMARMQPDSSKLYSYADYLTWEKGERIELIDGLPHLMVAEPSRLHQQILLEFGRLFANFLKGKQCEVNIAPFDVRLPKDLANSDEETYTVVQPDLVVVCDRKKLDERGCKGAPDLVMEVISPSTAAHDYIKKMALYEQHGVKEYWIVHPVDEIVMVHLLRNGTFERPTVYDREGVIEVEVVEGLDIDLKEVFEVRESE